MENSNLGNDHHKISPTAKIAAYFRSLSDIPYSVEIAELLEAEKTAKQILGDKMKGMASFFPLFIEARYKVINHVLKKSGIDNILELACGISPRGLELAANNITYVGTDLPENHTESYPIIMGIASRMGISTEKLHLQPANALDKEQLAKAVAHFKGKRFGICNEGLLMYLKREEQKTLAQNVRNLLVNQGGIWVTTDIAYGDRKQFFKVASPELESAFGDISKLVERNIAGNDFEDESDATGFYESLGFKVEKIPLYDGSYQLSTLSNIPGEMKDAILALCSKAKGWVLTPTD